MSEKREKLIEEFRKIIQEVIEEIRNDNPIGAKETARLILAEVEKYLEVKI